MYIQVPNYGIEVMFVKLSMIIFTCQLRWFGVLWKDLHKTPVVTAHFRMLIRLLMNACCNSLQLILMKRVIIAWSSSLALFNRSLI